MTAPLSIERAMIAAHEIMTLFFHAGGKLARFLQNASVKILIVFFMRRMNA